MRKYKNILVTGGSGFIGTNFIRFLINETDFSGRIINADKLTYASNPDGLADLPESRLSSRYAFIKSDICDSRDMDDIFSEYDVDCVVNFAAETHVDRAIDSPEEFISTNINGTFTLLETARKSWKNNCQALFHHVSTDEIFGSLDESGSFEESSACTPRNPYSASKASSNHLVNSYHHTYGMNITISNSSNNYGPFQCTEKFIPLIVSNIITGKTIPLYGDGLNIRDWLYVKNNCAGIWDVITKGRIGETYNIGGENEWTNKELVNKICELMAELTGKEKDDYKNLITYVKDRPGHDRRYAIKCDKIKSELGWNQSVTFEQGLKETLQWYLDNKQWIENIKSGAYKEWIDKNYSDR